MDRHGRSSDQNTFGTRLRDARVALGIRSQEALAEIAGVSRDTIAGWESGKTVPHQSTLDRLLSALLERALPDDQLQALEAAATAAWRSREVARSSSPPFSQDDEPVAANSGVVV